MWVTSGPKLTPKARGPRRGSAVQAGAAGVAFLEGSSLAVSRGFAMPAGGAFRCHRPVSREINTDISSDMLPAHAAPPPRVLQVPVRYQHELFDQSSGSMIQRFSGKLGDSLETELFKGEILLQCDLKIQPVLDWDSERNPDDTTTASEPRSMVDPAHGSTNNGGSEAKALGRPPTWTANPASSSFPRDPTRRPRRARPSTRTQGQGRRT